jgi:hypothetical protein
MSTIKNAQAETKSAGHSNSGINHQLAVFVSSGSYSNLN